jgi:hypothetical protein
VIKLPHTEGPLAINRGPTADAREHPAPGPYADSTAVPDEKKARSNVCCFAKKVEYENLRG